MCNHSGNTNQNKMLYTPTRMARIKNSDNKVPFGVKKMF